MTQAARKAQVYAGLCEAGKDPRKELGDAGEVLRLEERQRPKVSFTQLADYYLSDKGHSDKWLKDVESCMRNYLTPWLGKRIDISTIDDEEVLKAYNEFKQSGRGIATNLMKTFSAMWNYSPTGPSSKSIHGHLVHQ